MADIKNIKIRARHNPNRTDAENLTDVVVDPATNAAFTISSFNFLRSDVDMTALVSSIELMLKRVSAGDMTDIEKMLVSQATALQSMFMQLSTRAAEHTHRANAQFYLNMAFKAQSQCRTTIQTLLELKFPKTTAFVKQANITSGPQQVNNAARPDTCAGKNESMQNEQSLQIEDLRHERETLDFSGTGSAAAANPEMETLAKVNRAENTGRKGKGRSKRL